MKRHRDEVNLDHDFLDNCEKKFYSDPVNIITRNAIVTAGSFFTTINSSRINEINHIFLNTVKKHNVKATNQQHSGRCWMFAALNTFRHTTMRAVGLNNFEFSEVYLFFWDKLERANSYLNWFITHPEYSPNDRAFDYMIQYYLSDGGWWNTFANLVEKYGLIPSGAMKETYHSGDSEDMNSVIKERLDSTVNHIIHRRKRGASLSELQTIRKTTVEQIYGILVKFLGEPPKKFSWSFFSESDDTDDGGIPMTMDNLTPLAFKEMVAPNISMHDFIPLSHVPTQDLEFGKLYRINWTSNVESAKDCTLLNVDTDDLARYAKKSILAGIPVWFVADVTKHFNHYFSTLDDVMDGRELVFGKSYKFLKGDRITFRDTEGNHAMALTGVNVDDNDVPISWQVENSWGYYDYETPGLDGFLTMSHSWFKKYVVEVVVHKKFLSRSLRKKLEQDPITLDPWNSMSPATRAGNVDAPRNYIDILASHKK